MRVRNQIILKNLMILLTSSVLFGCNINNSSVSISTPPYEQETVLLQENFTNLDLWEFENCTTNYKNSILNVTIEDSYKPIVLSTKHLGLQFEKNYELTFTASGDATLNFKLLNNNNYDIVPGLTTSYPLTSELVEQKLIFVSNEDYDNVYLVIEATNSFSISSLNLKRINIYNDYEAPVITGVNNELLYITTKFDYKKNLKVVDNIDGDLTYKCEFELPLNDIEVDNSVVTFKKTGDYKFVYKCMDREDNIARVERIITVIDSMPSGHQLIKNGTFDQGLDYWYNDQYEGGKANFSVVKEGDNNIMQAEVTSLPAAGSYQPFPRFVYGKIGSNVATDELVIEKGASYTLSFRMKCSVNRSIQVLVGEVLDQADEQGKWTRYFAQEAASGGWGLLARNITPSWQEFKIDFTMALDETNTNGCVAFTFGDVGNNPQIGVISLDDVSLIKK